MFIQRTIISLLYPIVFRFVTASNAGKIFKALYPVIVATPLLGLSQGLITTLKVYLFRTPNDLLGSNAVFQTIRANANIIPRAVMFHISLASFFLGIVGRLMLFVSWGFALPVFAGLLFFASQEIKWFSYYMIQIWETLPIIIQKYIIEVQNYVITGLTSIKSTGEKPTGYIIMFFLFLKNVTYFGGWEYLHFGLDYLSQTAPIHYIIGLGIWGKLWSILHLQIIYDTIIWYPINWLAYKCPIIFDFINYIFIEKGFFINEKIKDLLNYIFRR
jgi:hypothetical protein